MKIIFVTAVLCFSYYMQLCSACFYGGFRVAPIKNIIHISSGTGGIHSYKLYSGYFVEAFYPGERISLQSNLAYSLVIL